MPFIGEIAALITSLSFAFTATFFTFAGRRVGSVIVNRTRLLIGIGMVFLTHWLILGAPFPTMVEPERWLWLGLSGIIGLTLGDAFLFQAFIWVGARISMLIMSLAPVIAALLAWVFLGEVLNGFQILGGLLTIGGVAWVILEREPDPRLEGIPSLQSSPIGDQSLPHPEEGVMPSTQKNRNYLPGILLALGGATGQASGLILSKIGLYGDYPPLSGNFIRMLTATAAIWLVTILRGQGRESVTEVIFDRRALLHITGGAIFGPLIGVTFSLLAIQKTAVGIASTLMALPPIFLLPIGTLVFQERITGRGVLGTLVAIMGVGILFLT